MRIIAGKLRGKKLLSPKTDDIRPTLDRVREAIFSSIAFDLADAEVLDLFGGTGAISIEAISRGAKRAVIVDNDKNSINLIKENVKNCRLEEQINIIFEDYDKFLLKNKQFSKKFDIIFLDPPYATKILDNLIYQIDKSNIWTDGVIIVLETDETLKTPEETANFIKIKDKVYSKSRITMYKKK